MLFHHIYEFFIYLLKKNKIQLKKMMKKFTWEFLKVHALRLLLTLSTFQMRGIFLSSVHREVAKQNTILKFSPFTNTSVRHDARERKTSSCVAQAIALVCNSQSYAIFCRQWKVFSVAKKHCTGMQEKATERSTMRRPQVSLTKSV